MLMDEYKPQGQLKALVDAFKNADEMNDEEELIAIIQLLDLYKWEAKTVSLVLAMQTQLPWKELEGYEDHLILLHNKLPEVNLTEKEKLERVVQMAESPYVNYNQNEIKSITDTLENNNLTF